jgi:hypothetical protein
MSATLLQLIKTILLKKEEKLIHPILFLFNNGEEVGLIGKNCFLLKKKGSLAFMRNKEFGVETIKRFINLDSISSEGFELFSRASPSSIALEYNVPRPHSNVIGGIYFFFIFLNLNKKKRGI